MPTRRRRTRPLSPWIVATAGSDPFAAPPVTAGCRSLESGARSRRMAAKATATKSLDEAVAALRKDPTAHVRTEVQGLAVEIRVVREEANRTAAAIFEELGPWEGEDSDEIAQILTQCRRQGSTRRVPDL